MPNFAYSGRTRAGQTVSGDRAADTMDAAVAALRREQIQVTRITPSTATAEAAAKKPKAGTVGKKVAAKNLAVFTRQFSVMIDAGLAGGILDTILKRLATYIEKAVKLAGQVKSAMIYPIAVVVIAGVVVAVILWKVIPTFAQLFSGLGADLPLPKRVVIALSDNLVSYFPIILVAVV